MNVQTLKINSQQMSINYFIKLRSTRKRKKLFFVDFDYKLNFTFGLN